MLAIDHEIQSPPVDPVLELRNGIIKQAVLDYKKALKKLDKNPEDKIWYRMKQDCIRFFHSEWFKTLCQMDNAHVDGDEIIRYLNDQHQAEKRAQKKG